MTTNTQMNTKADKKKSKMKKTDSKKSDSKKSDSKKSKKVKQVAAPVQEPVNEAPPVEQQVKKTNQKLKKPKRALTAYNCFSKEQYPIHKNANPDLKFGDVQKLVSTQWKGMSDSEKAPYVTQHETDKKRYATELETYNSTPDEQKVLPKKKKVKYTGPKRALSAYMFFKQDASNEIKKANADISFGDLQKEVGVRWTSLKSSTKKDDTKRLAKYHKQHEEDKARYVKELAAYNAQQAETATATASTNASTTASTTA